MAAVGKEKASLVEHVGQYTFFWNAGIAGNHDIAGPLANACDIAIMLIGEQFEEILPDEM